jgi:hypothetical protein
VRSADVTAEQDRRRHFFAVVDAADRAVEVSTGFVTDGLAAAERVIVVGATDHGAGALSTRLRSHGADPARAVRDGQLVFVDRDSTRALYGMPGHRVGDELRSQAAAAVRDGYTGVRFGGLLPRLIISPLERMVTDLTRQCPVTVLCLYHALAPAEVLTAVDGLHDGQVRCEAVFDDGNLLITAVRRHTLEMAGRVHPGNRGRVLAALADAADAGYRTINAVAAQGIDRSTLPAILALGFELNPNPARPGTGRPRARQRKVLPATDPAARNGFPVPGQTAAEVITNLTWRTFGRSRPNRAETVLDWAGLLDRGAGPVSQVADRYGTTPATVINRVRQVHHRGGQTPLTPVQLRDATRAALPTEDALSRLRIAQLLGLRPLATTVT